LLPARIGEDIAAHLYSPMIAKFLLTHIILPGDGTFIFPDDMVPGYR
jgi:hypothetical protein